MQWPEICMTRKFITGLLPHVPSQPNPTQQTSPPQEPGAEARLPCPPCPQSCLPNYPLAEAWLLMPGSSPRSVPYFPVVFSGFSIFSEPQFFICKTGLSHFTVSWSYVRIELGYQLQKLCRVSASCKVVTSSLWHFPTLAPGKGGKHLPDNGVLRVPTCK
jgi:hypothetical protein